MRRHDVAIYAPESADWYERVGGRGGGAERQMTLLARALAARDLGVAHIVLEPDDPVALPANLALVVREPYAGEQPLVGRLREAARIWRALRAADAGVTIVRAATPAVGVAALYCKVHRRRLIFSSANDSDFAPESSERSLTRRLYRLGARLADVIVVQSREQSTLARRAFPCEREIVHIPSFYEPADDLGDLAAEPDTLLWIGRVRAEKAPLRYIELARAIPDARFVMVPVELGSKVEYRELRDAASTVPNLELRDRIPHAELMKLVANAVAVVNTSHVEGLPNVFLEAWARGVPVLTLECDPDGVIERHGLGIAASGSWERFVAGARELLATRLRREELSGRTRAYVDEVHSPDSVGARWAELVARVASQGPRALLEPRRRLRRPFRRSA